MTQKEIIENIEIARQYLSGYRLLLPEDEVLFDCYCLPSFGRKAFYAQIGVKNGVYRANCAYTRYADHFGNESCSRHFTAVENNKHPAENNDIFCKTVFPEREAVEKLLNMAKHHTAEEAHPQDGVIIDGITAGIRLFENGGIVRDIVLDNPAEPETLLDEICSFSDII